MRNLFLVFVLLAIGVSGQAQEAFKGYYIYSIYFGGGSYYIDEEQSQGLEEWLNSIEGVETYNISVHGHTDNIGSKEYNDWLAKMRNQNTIQELILRNISRELISIESFGELNPIYDNSTLEGRLKNRRVDIIIKPIAL